jgi:transposase
VEALAGSRKSETRMQERARIVLLLAAEGMASSAVALKLGCMRGMVSKWRVRYARDRMSGLSESGGRGTEPKHGPEHAEGVLAMQDRRPDDCANWTAPLLARELGDIHDQYIWSFDDDHPSAPE